VSYKKHILEFDVSDETMRKTALGGYEEGDTVNLERAMLVSTRFGGHFVLGHVDGVGKVRDIRIHDGSVEFIVSYPKQFSHLLIEKGSVAVDGISLTVCDLKDGRFSVYLIPHTLKETHLGGVKKGSDVNLEFDVLGKYAAKAAVRP
jgi:riboflavin synthase